MDPRNGGSSADGLPCKNPADVIGATPDNQPKPGLNPSHEIPSNGEVK